VAGPVEVAKTELNTWLDAEPHVAVVTTRLD
jgi:hypothetical protein